LNWSADPGLPEHDPQIRVPLEGCRPDHLGEHLQHADLKGGRLRRSDITEDLVSGVLIPGIERRADRMQVERQLRLRRGLPDRLPLFVPQRHHADLETELCAFQTELGAAPHLGSARPGCTRQTANPGEAPGQLVAELRQEIVVGAHHHGRDLGIRQVVGQQQNPVDHLTDDTVALHVLGPQLGDRRAHDTASLVCIETFRRHALDARTGVPGLRCPVWTDPTHVAEVQTLACDPDAVPVLLDNVRDLLAQARGGVCCEQIDGKTREIDVSVGGDDAFRHGVSLLLWLRADSTTERSMVG
jgi:hypothetical protein